MRKPPLRHNGDGYSGQILISSSDEGLVRIEILPMNDKPFIDMTLTQFLQLVNTVKVKYQMGEI